RCRGRGRTGLERKRQLAVLEPDRHGSAVLQPAEQDLIGQRIAYFGLDDPRERARPENRVVALLREPRARLRLQRDRDPALGKLRLELQDEFLDNSFHYRGRERVERDDGVEAVA